MKHCHNYGEDKPANQQVFAFRCPQPFAFQYPPAKHKVVRNLHRSLCILICCFATSFRIGEAAVPGPVIGNMNPTGLMGKSVDLESMPQGVYSIQETHLTGPGITKFRQELAWRKSQYHLCHGAPAPPKNGSLRTIGGRHTGVGYLSSYPCRSISHCWSPEDFQTGRCLAAAAFVQHRWITMGTVYGFSENRQSIEVQQNTGRLLEGLTSRIVDGATGLRVIAGDWNLPREQIPQADYWEAKGWMEAQQLAMLKWNHPLQATCKRATVRDYLYLSPEIIPFVEDIQLDWSFFSDHAVIKVFLSDLSKPCKVPMWRKPKTLPWPKPKDQVEWNQPSEMSDDMDTWYKNIWTNTEEYAKAVHKAAEVPPPLKCQLGRATTFETKMVMNEIAPVKPNRSGDIQSQLTTTNLQHSRWTKQVRRLQHYTRFVASDNEAKSPDHQALLWRSILNATGFPEGFLLWWKNLYKVFLNSPNVIPTIPPGFEIANAVFVELTHHYRTLETSLQQTRIQHATERRSRDPLLIYRDLQKERAEPVQTIIAAHNLKITATAKVSETMTELSLADPVPEGSNQFHVNEINVQPCIVDPHHVQLPTEIASKCGNQLKCTKVVGDVTTIIKAFEDEWAPRWKKHDEVPPETWETILDFLKTAIPAQKVSFPPITRELWRRTVAKKKKYAAIGPDGVSRHDMQNMPDCIVDDMLHLINKIEGGHRWPSQAVTGIVAALAKTPQAQTTNQFRPICIFPLFLRVWGSIRARQCLKYLATLVPTTLLGNIPGRSPKQLWFRVQQAIEYAYAQNTEVAGSVADLVKCFNTLPRHPLLALAEHLGLPSEVIIPWKQCLAQIERRFQVRGAIGRPIDSSTGFPEGDAMSVVAMAICNVACEVFMLHRLPRVQTWSYVDNLETLAHRTVDAIQSLEVLSQFCALMDLQIDFDKSYIWSNTAEGRKMIRDKEFAGKLFARDLGGHLNYTKLRTNCTLQEKIAQFAPFWQRLCRSFATASQKERALVVAAWPNLFYGVCTVTMGKVHFEKLRTQACRALNYTQNGLSPMLQLSCISNAKADPEFHCVVATVMSFRDCTLEDMSEYVLHQVNEGASLTPGPCCSLVRVLEKIFWRWKEGGICQDHLNIPCNILTCPKQELYNRLLEAWQHKVFGITAENRKTMKGLQNADARLTQLCMQSLPASNFGLMRCALNGTQFANNALVHTGLVASSECQYCKKPDSGRHRHWECEYFADIRKQYPDISGLEATAEPCLLNHGWMPQSQDLPELRRCLLDIPDTTGTYMVPPQASCRLEYQDLFSDGSCIYPADATLRVSSWGVVEWTGDGFWPVSLGGVPGWKQTSLRAEIFAVLACLKISVRCQRTCRIWTDNAEVFAVLTALVQGICPEVSKKPDADLWHIVIQQFLQCRQWIKAIFKVKSHLDPESQDSPLDQWATEGNQHADLCANAARGQLDPRLWDAWDKVKQHNQTTLNQGRQVHAMYVAIAEKARKTHMAAAPQNEPTGFEDATAAQTDPGILNLAQLMDDQVPKHFKNEETNHIRDWLTTLISSDSPTTWVSFHQLLIDYQKYSGRLGPTSNKGKWLNEPLDVPYNHKQHVLWMSQFLKNFSHHSKVPIVIEQRRPPSHMLAFWCGCIRVNMTQASLNAINDHLRSFTKVMPIRNITKDLANMVPGCSN